MKNIIKDTSAVSYLLLVSMGVSIIISGIFYNVTSDVVDLILESINNYAGTPLEGVMDSSSIETGNILLVAFKFVLIPTLVAIVYFCFVMSQRNPMLKSW